MKYWLNLSDDRRVLSAAEYREGDSVPDSAVIVDALPEGDLYDYRYVEGDWVRDPQPKKTETAVPPTLEEQMTALSEAVMGLLMGGNASV